MAAPDPVAHHWYTPAECAALLGGEAHGEKWRAPCPAHGGSNPTALGIAQGRDRDGNPMTLLHCFANQCPIEDICAAMGIEVKALFCIHPTYARATRHLPRTRSPRIAQIKRRTDQLTPLTPDEMAQVMLEEMIVSDPQWIRGVRASPSQNVGTGCRLTSCQTAVVSGTTDGWPGPVGLL